jgi:LacI family transcriptional regulator
MDELGYRPNWAGRALRRQRTGLVGALVSAPSNPWRENLVALAQEELARHDLDLVVFPDARPGVALDRIRDLLDRRAVDACFTVHVEDGDDPGFIANCAIPVIAFAESGFDGVAKVRHRYADAAREAALALTERGVRRFVLVREGSEGGVRRDVIFTAPIVSVLDDEQGAVEVVTVELTYRLGADLSELPWTMLSRAGADDPVVVMCASDRLAIEIAVECARRGIGLGRAVGIVGRGDLPEGTQMPVPLSTLGTAVADYTSVFTALAEASRTGVQIDEEWTFPWRFIERASTSGLLQE